MLVGVSARKVGVEVKLAVSRGVAIETESGNELPNAEVKIVNTQTIPNTHHNFRGFSVGGLPVGS